MSDVRLPRRGLPARAVPGTLHVLLVDEREELAPRLHEALARLDAAAEVTHVASREGYVAQLSPSLDVIVAAEALPGLDAATALRLLQDRQLDVPLVVVGRDSGEDRGAALLAEGAADYVAVDEPARLGPAVARAAEARLLRQEVRRARAALQQSEALSGALLSAYDGPAALLDHAGAIVAANEAWGCAAPAIGAPTAGEAERSYLEAWRRAAERRDGTARHVAGGLEAVVRHRKEAFVAEYAALDGSGRAFELRAVPITGSGGLTVVAHREVSALREAEQALAAAETRRAAAADLAGEYLYEAHGTDGEQLRPAWIVGPFERTTGYDPSAIGDAEGWRALVHPEDRGAFGRRLERALSGRGGTGEHRIQTKTGEVRWVQETLMPVVDEATGRITGVRGAVRDVTDQRRAAELLARREQEFRMLVESSRDLITRFDPALRLQYVNPVIERVSGLTPQAVLGRTAREAGLPASVCDRWEGAVRRVFETGREETVSVSFVTRTGPVHLETRLVPERQEEGRVAFVLGVSRDVTECRTVEETLRRRVRQQAAIAELGLRAAAEIDTPAFAELVVRRVSEVLGVRHGLLMELLPDGKTLLLRAGTGWKEGYVGHLQVSASGDSQASLALRSAEPVMIDDLRLEGRFSGSDLLREHGLMSGITVSVPTEDGPYGVLGMYSPRGGILSREDADFLQSVANLVGQLAERQRVRTAQRESEERWRLLVEANPEPILITIDGVIAYVNPAGAVQVGAATPAELVGRSVLTFVPEELHEAVRSRLVTVQRGEASGLTEMPVRRLNGEARLAEVFSVPVSYDGRRAVQTVIRDVTERHEYEHELVRAKETAQQMNRLKTSFMANMSHEVRTPLTAILGFAQLLEPDVEGEASEFVGLIQQSGRRLMSTLDAVLDLARLESRDYTLHPESVDVVVEAHEVFRALAPEADARGLSVRFACPSDAPILAYADREALRRVLRIVFSNAVKFTLAGGVTIRALDEGPHVVVDVEDTGIGIDPSFMPHLFEAFYQESSGETRNYEGAGLGLAICKNLMDLVGGVIEVDSEPGVGTTFRLRFPAGRPGDVDEALSRLVPPPVEHAGFLHDVDLPDAALDHDDDLPDAALYAGEIVDARAGRTEEAVAALPEVAAGASGGAVSAPEPSVAPAASVEPDPADERPQLLVVEDNESTRRLLAFMLKADYGLHFATGADEALAIAAERVYDAVLLDINLGERRTGVEVMHALWQIPEYRRVPVVACTAYALPGDEARYLAAGFHAYVSKPVRKPVLLDVLKKILASETPEAAPPPSAQRAKVSLPPMPGTLPEIIQLVSRNDVVPDTERLTRVLSRDPVTATWVLRHANAAYYGLRQQVVNVDRAVMLLGFDAVCNLVLMEVLRQAFADFQTPRSTQVYRYLMRTSIATAAFARSLTDHLGLEKPDTAFTAGLLVQVGRLALLSSDAESYTSLWFEGAEEDESAMCEPPVGQEMLRFESDSIQLGVQVAREWGLSEDYLTVLQFYRRLPKMIMDRHRLLVLTVTAGHEAARLLYASPEEQQGPESPEKALRKVLVELARNTGTLQDDLFDFLLSQEDSVRAFAGMLFDD